MNHAGTTSRTLTVSGNRRGKMVSSFQFSLFGKCKKTKHNQININIKNIYGARTPEKQLVLLALCPTLLQNCSFSVCATKNPNLYLNDISVKFTDLVV